MKEGEKEGKLANEGGRVGREGGRVGRLRERGVRGRLF